MTTALNYAFLKLPLRAERYDRNYLVSTFVDVGSLFTFLSNREHQILYGRRGTGKTHALSYLAGMVESQGDIVIQIDMRTVGSSGGIYSDPNIPIPERATRLLVDTLTVIHDNILNYVIEHDDDSIDLGKMGLLLDQLADSITEVKVLGHTRYEETTIDHQYLQNSVDMGLTIKSYNLSANLKGVTSQKQEHSTLLKNVRSGIEQHRVHFGTVSSILSKILMELAPKRIWILLDEWSEIPLDLQPYLADLLRRTIFPIKDIIVKIAAIEHRCQFRISAGNSGYIGFEVGADVATSLNLDEFMVFDNDAEQAKRFFSELLFKHIRSIMGENSPSSPADLVHLAFTQITAFEEFVRSAEGVPRDAINILALAAKRANSNRISVPDIRFAAKEWYNRTKEKAIQDKPEAHKLLRWIIDEVIRHRRARAFLLRSDVRHPLIDYLFDARLLHIIKQNVSSHDQPGVRYNVYSIDYGCYVDLINTSRAPQGLFEIETQDGAQFVEVPANDYRSIRRAVLDIEKFDKSQTYNCNM